MKKSITQTREEETRQGEEILARKRSPCKESEVREGRVMFEELKVGLERCLSG